MAQVSTSPLVNIPLEITIIDQIGSNGKNRVCGLWDDIKGNELISPVIVAMVDALLTTNEDLYLYADIVLGGEQIFVCQIV